MGSAGWPWLPVTLLLSAMSSLYSLCRSVAGMVIDYLDCYLQITGTGSGIQEEMECDVFLLVTQAIEKE